MRIIIKKFLCPSLTNIRRLSLVSKPKNYIFGSGAYPTPLTSRRGIFKEKLIESNCQRCLKANYCSDTESSTTTASILSTPEDFADILRNEKIKRCFIVNCEGSVKTSHPVLDEIADVLQTGKTEYDNHDAIFFTHGSKTGCLMAVFLWRTHRGQGAGGVDLKSMRNLSEMIHEGNRFSKHLGIKSALAGNWAGGGKGLIAGPPASDTRHWDLRFRHEVFQDFGEFLTSLNGCFIAGAGTGSVVPDMDTMFTQTRYISNLSSYYGGTANTALYTGKGVVKAMEAALTFLNMGSLTDKKVAIQGGGNVAQAIIEELLDQEVRHIYVTECNALRADDLRDKFAQRAKGKLTVAKVSFNDTSVFKQHCDIFSPCAGGKVLNSRTIPLLDTKIVCGAANCQVDSEEDHERLMDMKVTYVTDVVPNRMGIVSKLLEPFGRLENDRELEKHLSEDWEHSIYQTTLQVLEHAASQNISPEKAAFILGEELSQQKHPLYPNRTKQIIDGLINSGWHEGNDFWRRQHTYEFSPDMI